jgi:hypothetical protein
MHDEPSCNDDRMKCDGRLLLLAFPGIVESTGRSIAQKTNLLVAIFLTDSLHQFA